MLRTTMVELDGITALIALFEHGSVQGAARGLGVSRATVRRRIDALEAAVGAVLVRSGGKPRPTDAGTLIVQKGRQLLMDAERLADAARDIERSPCGTLTVALTVGMPRRALAAMHHTMMSMWPQLSLVFETHADPIARLPKHADIAVAPLVAPPPTGMDAIPVRTSPLRLMASPGYLARRGAVMSRAQLADHDLLIWSAGVADPNYLPLRDGSHLRVSPRVVANDVEMLRIMAGRGAGLALIPATSLPAPLEVATDLQPVLPDVLGCDRKLCVFVSSSMRTVPRIRVALELSVRLAARPSVDPRPPR